MWVLAVPNSKGFSEAPSKDGKPDTEIVGVFLTGADMNFVALHLSTESGFPVVFHQYANSSCARKTSDGSQNQSLAKR